MAWEQMPAWERMSTRRRGRGSPRREQRLVPGTRTGAGRVGQTEILCGARVWQGPHERIREAKRKGNLRKK
jgi:hypothetical protein